MVRLFAGARPPRRSWWPAAVLGGGVFLTLTMIAMQNWRQSFSEALPKTGPAIQAPAPPEHEPWISPLARQCRVNDQALVSRMRSLQTSLPGQVKTVAIDPSNFGQRTNLDAYGNLVDPTPSLVVLHETVYGIGSAINTFTTHHPHDDDQVSYHLLIGEDGQVVQTLDPSQRAFGAGYSAFDGRWDITNPSMSGSVNNFALHVSLETPLDGEDDAPAHSGYTTLQYEALAVVLADWMKQYRIPFEHITTHRHVDLGAARADPRSFNWQALQLRLAALGALC
jgi:N-acetylmuramoyl-L-alanine amidase